MSGHAPEPWHISEMQIGETVYRCEIIDATGRRVLLQECESMFEHITLRHIVACVNACKGIETERLENETGSLLSGQAIDIARLTTENHALLGMLRDVREAIAGAEPRS